MQRSTPLHLSVVLSLASGVVAQTINVLPSSALTTSPGNYNSSIFYGTTSTSVMKESRTQVLYDAADVQNSGLFLSMQFRRPANLGNANVASTFNVQTDMSMSQVPHLSASATYASNHGPSVTTVFNGPINLPANTSGTWPRPWETAIPFTTPFVFVAAVAKSLCVEFIMTNGTATQPWYVEAATANTGAGTRVSNPGAQSTCKFSNGAYNNAIGHLNPVVGGNWYVNYQGGLPANLPAWGALGSQGVGGSYAGMTLPISLAPFGAPGCVWSVDALVVVPLTATGTGSNVYTWPTLPVPNNPALAGASFYDHSLFVDPAANSWGVVTGWSSKWTIGDGIRTGLPLTQVTRTGANATPTGTVSTYTGPTLQINL